MKFDELDREMRVFETAHDYCALPGIYMVARIDGRNFTRLTKETIEFEAPFDIRMRDYMIETTARWCFAVTTQDCGRFMKVGKVREIFRAGQCSAV